MVIGILIGIMIGIFGWNSINETYQNMENVTNEVSETLIYDQAKDRNYIYLEPEIVDMLNTTPPTSEEIEKQNIQRNRNEMDKILSKQKMDKMFIKIKQSIFNYHNFQKKDRCLSNNCCNEQNGYYYQKPKKYCEIKGMGKKYCVEIIKGAKCSKTYDNPYCY